MDCSLCHIEIVGVGVLVADEKDEWKTDEIDFYHSDGDVKNFALLHPVCFVKIFEELLRQEQESTFIVAVSKSGNLKEALQIP